MQFNRKSIGILDKRHLLTRKGVAADRFGLISDRFQCTDQVIQRIYGKCQMPQTVCFRI